MGAVRNNCGSKRPRFTFIKKRFKIIVTFIMSLVMVFFAVPYLLTLSPVRKQITEKLSSAIDGRLQAENISWAWLPSPCLVIESVMVSNAMVEAEISGVSVRLNLFSLQPGKSAITVELRAPDIQIKTLQLNSLKEEKASGEKKSVALSEVAVVIKNGHIRLPSDGIFKNLAGHDPPLEIFDLDTTVLVTPSAVDIQGACRLTFIEKLNASVRFEKRKAKNPGGGNLYWTLDINGETVNMTESVEKVMLLFGTNRVAKQVCGIARGGRARRFGYAFQGYTEEFKELGNMRITAVPESAIVQVPGVDLLLENAGGPIKIENAILTGKNLSATLGNSYAKNGSLQLGLLGQKRDFNLALDLDADISELPRLLKENLVKNNPRVTNELSRIENAKGRAAARLIIGDTLNQMAVKVTVSNSDSRLKYKRLNHPVRIGRGAFEFYPDRIAWNGVKGTVGPHAIHNTKGTVFWKGGVRLDIETVEARIHSGVLLKELTAWPVIQKKLSPVVRSIRGIVEVGDARLSGPAENVQDWEYHATLKTKKLDLDTPYLPGKAGIAYASAQVGKQKINLSGATVSLGDQRLKIKMDLNHDAWKNFSGNLELQGNIEKNLARWIKKKNWIPPLYLPATPINLEPMRIAFDKTGVAVTASMVTRYADQKEIKTGLDFEFRNKKLALKKLTIISPEEKGSIWAFFKHSPDPVFNVGFEGSLSRDTVSLILEENKLLSGNITGDFLLSYFFNTPDASHFKGNTEIHGFSIHAGNNRMGITHAELIGHDSFVEVKRASLALNDETMTADGRIFLSEKGLACELETRSDYISTSNLMQLYQSFAGTMAGTETLHENRGQSVSGRPSATPSPVLSLAGSIAFDCKQFEYIPESPGQSLGNQRFIWDNLRGEIRIPQDGRVSVTVSEGMICGVETTGVLKKLPEPLFINISAGKQAKQDIKNFFACIGIDKNYLTGRFLLDAEVVGVPDKWENGHLMLVAEDGVMDKMEALSKIFTLINVTELFSRSKIRNIFSRGFPYSEILLSGNISDNRLHINEAFVKGDGLDFFATGSAGLKDRTLDLIVYVKPFKTIDSIVHRIPLVGKRLGEFEEGVTLIPIKVKGRINDPEVSFYRGRYLDRDKKYLRKLLNKTISLPSKVVETIKPDASFYE
jgi:AsmA-like C-terminal region